MAKIVFCDWPIFKIKFEFGTFVIFMRSYFGEASSIKKNMYLSKRITARLWSAFQFFFFLPKYIK